LRNLDLAARASLIKSKTFREQNIPQTATTLAIKFSQTLAPLFSNTVGADKELSWDGFATWRDVEEEWVDRRQRLTKMFEFALKTKADSCLNIQDYEMVIYPPGMMFDAKTMKTESLWGVEGATSSCEGRVVDICVEAAVFAHTRKALLQNASVSEAIVPSNNFVRREAGDRARIAPAAKAVVILADKQRDVKS
jgi:hypothetical protein